MSPPFRVAKLFLALATTARRFNINSIAPKLNNLFG
ncbi:hypothetical protein BH10CYA1_BH10CYA1_51290 [soil metagenome]